MKHSYQMACDCARCLKERERRSAQSAGDRRNRPMPEVRRRRRVRTETRRPVAGSQEWAETRGDDIDSESGDY